MFAQDEWHLAQAFTLSYGLRYDYYTPLREADDRIVKFNIDTGLIDPNTTPFYHAEEEQLPAARRRHLVADSERRSSKAVSASSSARARPRTRFSRSRPSASARRSARARCSPIRLNADLAACELHQQPEQPRPTSRARTRTNTRCRRRSTGDTASVQQELGGNMALTVAYVGSQGRNLFLRSIANRTIGVQSNGAGRRHAGPRVRHRDLRERTGADRLDVPGLVHRQHPAALRRDRLQDQRRARQLQLDAAGAHAPFGERARR